MENTGQILTDIQVDALKEVGNISMCHATTSLSQMVNKRIEISLPELKFVPLVEVVELVKNKKPVVGIVLGMNDEVKGYMLLMFTHDTAKNLAKLVMESSSGGEDFDEMEISALQEIANIMCGSYISTLSDFLGIKIGLTIPAYIFDMSEAIVDQIVGMMSQDVNEVLFIDTEFYIDKEKVDGDILIFTESESMSKMLGAVERILNR